MPASSQHSDAAVGLALLEERCNGLLDHLEACFALEAETTSADLKSTWGANGAGKATGSAPNILTTTCCSTSPTAMVVISGVTWLPRLRTGRNATRSTSTPR